MLKENGPPPTGKWADIAVLEPVRDYKARHASTMLTFDAVVQAVDQIEAKRAQKQASAMIAHEHLEPVHRPRSCSRHHGL